MWYSYAFGYVVENRKRSDLQCTPEQIDGSYQGVVGLISDNIKIDKVLEEVRYIITSSMLKKIKY